MAVAVSPVTQAALDKLYQTAQQIQTGNLVSTAATTTPTTTPITTAAGSPTVPTAVTPAVSTPTPTATMTPVTTQSTVAPTAAPAPTAPTTTTAQGADIILSAADQARIKALQDQWNAATAAGNTAGAQAAHDAAQAIRAQYGYSGGGAGNQYVPTGTTPTTGGDAILSPADRARIAALTEQYNAAVAAGNTAGAQAAHAAAEAIRAQYGYSGGASGGEPTPVQQTLPQYTGTDIPAPQSGDQMIKDLYAAQQAAAQQALQAAYESNVNTANAAAAKLPAQYQAAEQQTRQQAELQRRNFNEQAASSGLNVGAGSQANLAQTSALQRDLSGIQQAQANAMSDLDLQRTQLETQYKNDVAQSIATGKFQEASALYEEFTRQQQALITQAQQQADENFRSYQARMAQYQSQQANLSDQAQTLASIGDFSGYAQLGYSQQQIKALTDAYQAAITAAAVKATSSSTKKSSTANNNNAPANNNNQTSKTPQSTIATIGAQIQTYKSQGAPNAMLNGILQQSVDAGAITYDEAVKIGRDLGVYF